LLDEHWDERSLLPLNYWCQYNANWGTLDLIHLDITGI
jgi:hypothetical protein